MELEIFENKKITCIGCEFFKSNGFNAFCEAFPKGIPEDILSADFDHNKIHPLQDNDIVFKQNILFTI